VTMTDLASALGPHRVTIGVSGYELDGRRGQRVRLR